MRTDRATHLNFRRELMARECLRAERTRMQLGIPPVILPAMLNIVQTAVIQSPIRSPVLSALCEQTIAHVDNLLSGSGLSQPRMQQGERFGLIPWRSDAFRIWHFMCLFAVGLREKDAILWFICAGQVNNFAHELEEASFPTMATMLVESLSGSNDREILAEHL